MTAVSSGLYTEYPISHLLFVLLPVSFFDPQKAIQAPARWEAKQHHARTDLSTVGNRLCLERARSSMDSPHDRLEKFPQRSGPLPRPSQS
jgi:hypothetical protein